MDYFFLDTETTGVSKDDKICEIAFSQVDEHLNVLYSTRSLINPERPISHGAGAVNGLTDAMVADAPTIEEFMAGEGQVLLGDDVVIVAHNAAFDMKYLAPHLTEGTQSLCTLKAAKIIYPDADNHKLVTLAYMLGILGERGQAHSASGDVAQLIEVVRCMMRDGQHSLEELLHVQNIPVVITKMAFGKHKGVKLCDLPKQYVTWLLTKCDNLNSDLRVSLLAL